MSKITTTTQAKNNPLFTLTQGYFGTLLARPDITEIAYNGDFKLWFLDTTNTWHQECVDQKTWSFSNLLFYAQTIASSKNLNISKSRPILSCVLGSGERIQIVIPPAVENDKISITIRKPSPTFYPHDFYVENGFYDEIVKRNTRGKEGAEDTSRQHGYATALDCVNNMKSFMECAVSSGKNILIAGGTGSGKTTYMKMLLDYIPIHERIITIEDVSEIHFRVHQNFVKLYYPSEATADDFLNTSTLLKSCLRMKPDRILLAELRGAETFDFINVLQSGHGGSLSTLHAGSCTEAIDRLIMMVLRNKQAQTLNYNVIREMLHHTIDLIVHITPQKCMDDFMILRK